MSIDSVPRCDRCCGSFSPSLQLTRIDTYYYENGICKGGKQYYMCPECAQKFINFLDSGREEKNISLYNYLKEE